MNRTPKQGDPYQVCTHLAASPDRTDRHYWTVPGRDPWIVLCDGCSASFPERRSVEIHGETFQLAADVYIEPDSSCVHHSAPGDVAADDPAPTPPTAKAPTSAQASKSEKGQLLQFLKKEKDPAWLPVADRAVSVAVELLQAFQAQAEARAKVELRRMELETQGMERLIRALDASAVTIDRLQALAVEREAAIVATLDRVQALIAPPLPREAHPSNGVSPIRPVAPTS